MLNQMVALGFRTWHGFWTFAKSWAELHQDHNGAALQFFAHVATAIGLPILTLLMAAVLALLITDRIGARRRRASHCRAMLLGLTAELLSVREAASEGAALFPARAGTLAHAMVERILNEPERFDLTSGQILQLHELRLRLVRTNSLLSASEEVGRSDTATPAAGGDRRRQDIEAQLGAIRDLCDDLVSGMPPPTNSAGRRRATGELSAARQRDRYRPDSPRGAERGREELTLRQEPSGSEDSRP